MSPICPSCPVLVAESSRHRSRRRVYARVIDEAREAIESVAPPSDLAEIGLADGLVGPKVGGRARQHDLARLEDVAAMGDVQRLQGVLLDEKDRRSLLVDLLDDGEDLLNEDRGQPQR